MACVRARSTLTSACAKVLLRTTVQSFGPPSPPFKPTSAVVLSATSFATSALLRQRKRLAVPAAIITVGIQTPMGVPAAIVMTTSFARLVITITTAVLTGLNRLMITTLSIRKAPTKPPHGNGPLGAPSTLSTTPSSSCGTTVTVKFRKGDTTSKRS